MRGLTPDTSIGGIDKIVWSLPFLCIQSISQIRVRIQKELSGDFFRTGTIEE